jgi:enoyl-CoA hydratase
MNEYRTILTKQRGSIVECRFNRPERRNAVDGFMHQELVALFRELGTDESTNVVILTGEGDAFCAGGDIEHMDDQFEKHEEAHPGLFRDAADLVNAILKVRQPIIAQVNGDAIGLGASLAVLSDIVMMSSTARIGDPHVRAGLVPGDGGLIAWPLLLPLNIAKELLFTGRLLSAAEAQALGLVNHVVLPENLESEVSKLAESLASTPQHALRFTKRILNKLLEDRATHALDLGLAFEAVTLGTSDHKNAVAKFVARAESGRQNQAPPPPGETPSELPS